MKRAIVGAVSFLAGAIFLWVAMITLGALTPADAVWWSLDGPQPTWPAALYFASLWLIPLSAGLVMVLLLVQFIRIGLGSGMSRR